MNSWVGRLREGVRTQLCRCRLRGWCSVLAGIGLPRLDEQVGASLPPTLQKYLFGGGAGAASTVLDAIASSMITVTSLTFSLTVVTLQLASSQFSPRLLRTFMHDRVVHLTLALFLTTFTYALTVLRTVRTKSAGIAEFVPQISVTTGFVLVVASVIGLVGFLAHLATQIRVETMLRNVYRDAATATLQRVLTDRTDDTNVDPPDLTPPEDAVALRAGKSGFLVGINIDALVKAAVDADAVIWMDRTVGASLTDGAPLGGVAAGRGHAPGLRGPRAPGRGRALVGAHRSGAHRRRRCLLRSAPAHRRRQQSALARHERPHDRGARARSVGPKWLTGWDRAGGAGGVEPGS